MWIQRDFQKLLFQLSLVILIIFSLSSSKVWARNLSDFVTTCGYGAVLGAVVGGLSLAFSDHPTDSLNPIARGASYGLYAGIITGVYLHEKQFQTPAPPPELAMIAPRFTRNRSGVVVVDGLRADLLIGEF
jgi:hypothetical protein